MISNVAENMFLYKNNCLRFLADLGRQQVADCYDYIENRLYMDPTFCCIRAVRKKIVSESCSEDSETICLYSLQLVQSLKSILL